MTMLFLSIATSGLPKGSLSADSRQQPWIVRMAACLAAEDGKPIEQFACGIRAGERKIDAEASRIHGIASAHAARSGVDESFALSMVCGLKLKAKADGTTRPDKPGFASNAKYCICWDATFVRGIIGSLFERLGEPAGAWVRPGLAFIGLQELCAPWLRLAPAKGDDSGAYRKPTRDEAAAFFLDFEPRPLPHAVDDNLRIEKLLFPALRSRGALDLEAAAA
jgi:hypothetical protein